jgi:hypothetical protein
MRAGPKSWCCVTTDTAGVPHGGAYGDVDTFEEEAKKHRLYLAWSRICKCFLIYTRRGARKYVCQLKLWDEKRGKPIPVSRALLKLMLIMWEKFCRTSDRSIQSAIALSQKCEKEKILAERREFNEYTRDDRARETRHRLGRRTRPLISVPRIVGVG